jgi:hypothetical protein
MKIKTLFMSIVFGMMVAGGIGAFSPTTTSIGEGFSNFSTITLVKHAKHHKPHKHWNSRKYHHWKTYYCPKQPHARACAKFCQHHGCHFR